MNQDVWYASSQHNFFSAFICLFQSRVSARFILYSMLPSFYIWDFSRFRVIFYRISKNVQCAGLLNVLPFFEKRVTFGVAVLFIAFIAAAVASISIFLSFIPLMKDMWSCCFFSRLLLLFLFILFMIEFHFVCLTFCFGVFLLFHCHIWS